MLCRFGPFWKGVACYNVAGKVVITAQDVCSTVMFAVGGA